MLDRTREPWPPDYASIFEWRSRKLQLMLKDRRARDAALAYYRTRPAEFIDHWCDTVDPRNASFGGMVRMPLRLFKRQRELVEFLHECVRNETSGLIEKARDMGATWVCVAFSTWAWIFLPGASIGWGSRKAQLVDRTGDMDSIFEKLRSTIRNLPPVFWPDGFDPVNHMTHMKIVSPGTGSSITGESGDEIGRGGRKLMYFKDESAHYERPERIEAALADNTRVQIDISSVNGVGNVFYRRRHSGVDWEPGRPVVRGKTNVFVMDWRDHPGKTQEWYEQRRAKAIDDGLLHVFKQEVDRDYAASVEGVIIPHEWFVSAIDAHIHLGMPEMEDGPWHGALDVADGGGDTNALSKRKGMVLKYLDEWGERDTGRTARRAVAACADTLPMTLQYDCIGVGAGIKAETNRLLDEKLMPRGLKLVPWDAGSGPQFPDHHVIPKDKASPLNKDFYQNLKAQGWWMLRRLFENTHRARTEGIRFRPDELISIDSRLPRLRSLEKEISQPTVGHSSRLKLLVNKTPEGTPSPNLADSVMMNYWPVKLSTYDSTMSWVG